MTTMPAHHQPDRPLNYASACGKIILSGEYAVVFGHPGLAVPSKELMTAVFFEERADTLEIRWPETAGEKRWDAYIRTIVTLLEKRRKPVRGTIAIGNSIPLGKGMGSSTALVIALCRCLLGQDCREEALKIEDAVNPGHSGLDFAVIWEERPILLRKGSPPKSIVLPNDLLKGSRLIDTGSPGEPTKDLVAWVRSRKDDPAVAAALMMIGLCTERILSGEPIKNVMRDHHRAQVALGVVTADARKIIADIEAAGGAAKVLGAGARTGGGGMVLAMP
jgi:mevalonate kinase